MTKLSCIILFLVFGHQLVFSQNNVCYNAERICFSNGYASFTNQIEQIPNPNDQVSYGCLSNQPNRSWFYFKIGDNGILNMQISQVNQLGNPLDVDYIVWGPFDNESCGASNLTADKIISCSYSSSNIENFTLSNVLQNQYYMLMLTNFSNQEGYLTISQTNFNQPAAATINCDLVCPLDLGPDTAICENSEIVLMASISDASYQWSSSTQGLLPDTTQSITVSPNVPTTYSVVVNKPGCVANATDSIHIAIYNQMVFQQPNNLVQCSSSGTASFDLTSIIPTLLENQNPTDFDYGFFHTETDAQNLSDIILNPTSYIGSNNQTIFVAIVNNYNPCVYVRQFELIVLPFENPILSASYFGQTITVNATGNGSYQYQIDNEPFQNSNVFENVAVGIHTINVITTNGCGNGSTTIEIIIPNEPSAISPQYFNSGDTIANLMVNGENVQWYSSATDRNSLFQATSTPLPLDTLLIDGNTYFASQTINGIESENRTPVVVLLNPLSSDYFALANLNFFPNPVKNSLTISNNSIIDSVEITSVLGQQMFFQKSNSLQTEVDLSDFSKGIYFVKVTSEGQEKTLKILKD